jgi:hypothetical protein
MTRPAEGGREGSPCQCIQIHELTTPDENPEIEPPETPAPVFAARALKSALFGTPAPPDDETIHEIEKPEEQEGALPRQTTMDLQSGSISPTKPPGILLTPGTATSRRKTVSFGHEVLDKEEKNADENLTAKDAAGNRYSSGVTISDKPKPTRLTRVLENAREGRAGRTCSEKSRERFESQPLLHLDQSTDDIETIQLQSKRRASKVCKSNQDLMQEFMTAEHFNGDMTMDLNEPHSQSGKYWKSEFEQYHSEAQSEMKKLMKYKNLAKSYAKRKDAEALDLAEKLKEEQRRVVSMEDKISKLSLQISRSRLDGPEDNSPVMIMELARQTALAVQYRAQVEEFRTALEGTDGHTDGRSGEERTTSPQKLYTLLDTQRELKKAREQLKEMAAFNDELRDLKKRLSAAEETNKKLQDENTKLTQELLHADLRLEREIEKSEKRRQGSQERLQKQEETLHSLRKDYDTLKESAKSQRRDAEHLLNKRHHQVVELKKELASRKGAESTAKDLQQALQEKTAENSKIISEYQRQIGRLINTQSQDIQTVTLPTKATLTEASQLTRVVATNNENSCIRDSHIPVLSHSITRPLKTLASTKHTISENPAGSPGVLQPPSSHSALLEITNGASSERLHPQISSSVQYTPLAHRFSNMSLEAPDMDLPTPEPSFLPQPPGRAIQEKNCQASPQPSMFVIPSSPPKQARIRSRTSTELARQRSITTLTNLPSSRLSGLEGSRSRNTLPPERAAAAKARLEHKNAEKKRAQALGAEKENLRN